MRQIAWVLLVWACTNSVPPLPARLSSRAAALQWQSGATMAAARLEQTATTLLDGTVLLAGGCANASGSCSGGPFLASAELFSPATGQFTSVGSMADGRAEQTATLLMTGQVLSVGGTSGASMARSELYDPATRRWSSAAAMQSARAGHTATLLTDGRLLVVGGGVATAEIYTPATGKWTSAGTMATPRAFHTATLFADGGVLVAGGTNGGLPLATSELWNAKSLTFSRAGSLAMARVQHTATLLEDQRVLVAGGQGSSGALASAEIYDPRRGWVPAFPMTNGRAAHSGTLLPNGQLLVAGGTNGGDLGDTELYDPVSGLWFPGASLSSVRSHHTATLLASGEVLIAGGTFFGAPSASTEIFFPNSPASASQATFGVMNVAREHPTATLLPSGKVLLVGGDFDWATRVFTGPPYVADLYDPILLSVSPAGRSPVAATATLLLTGKVLVTGGGQASLYDPATNSWTATGSMGTPRQGYAATLLGDGRVLASGGRDAVTPSSSFDRCEIYDPASGTWSASGSLTQARWGHGAVLLTNGKVLVAGSSATEQPVPAEIWDPVFGSWTLQASAKISAPPLLLPSGKVLFGANLFDPAANSWSPSGISELPGQSTTLWPSGEVLVAGGLVNSPVAGYPVAQSSGVLYDPVSTTTLPGGSGIYQTAFHTALLLPNNLILSAGGDAFLSCSGSDTRSCKFVPAVYTELWDEGLGTALVRTPTLDGPLPTAARGTALNLTGSLFGGLSEGASGNQQACVANVPEALFERGDNRQLTVAPVSSWTPTTATVTVPGSLNPGWHWLRIGVGGAFSSAQPIRVPAACGAAFRQCANVCINASACCVDSDCGPSKICVSGACLCDATHKACPNSAVCAPQNGCCDDAECGAKATCVGGACTCVSGTRACRGDCISSARCCSDGDCGAGGTCSTGACSCDNSHKLCAGPNSCVDSNGCCIDADCPGGTCVGGACSCDGARKWCGAQTRCVPSVACCADTDCGAGGVCRAAICVCDADHKQCAAMQVCVAKSACCVDADCGANQVCTNNACVCDSTHKLCAREGACIPNNQCCVDGDCGEGAVCTGGACACDNAHKSCPGSSTCVALGGCCDDNECGAGQICSANSCVCDAGHKFCATQNGCIPKNLCCTDSDCGIGGLCGGGTCTCDGAHKQCPGSAGCVALSACCADSECGANQVCTSGACVCDKSHKWCAAQNACVLSSACCTDGDCGVGGLCGGGTCTCDDAHKVCPGATFCVPQTGCCADSECDAGQCMGAACVVPAPPPAGILGWSCSSAPASEYGASLLVLLLLNLRRWRRRRIYAIVAALVAAIVLRPASAQASTLDQLHVGTGLFDEVLGSRWGVELAATYAPLAFFDLGVGTDLGRHPGGMMFASYELFPGDFRPFVELRGLVHNVDNHRVAGGGGGGGVRVSVPGGRLELMFFAAGFEAPSGYRSGAALVLAGYQIRLGALTSAPSRSASVKGEPATMPLPKMEAPLPTPPVKRLEPAAANQCPAVSPPVAPIDGGFRGHVTDLDDHPVKAELRLSGSELPPRELSANPEFDVRLVPGRYAVRVAATGYITRESDIALQAGETLVHDFQLRPVTVAPTVPPPPIVMLTQKSIDLRHPIHFAAARARILADSFELLDQVAQVLQQNPKLQVSIEGHTDNVGNPRRNRKLSHERAEAVGDYLVSRGVVAARLTAKGFGSERPINSNTTEEGRSRNRRVEFMLK